MSNAVITLSMLKKIISLKEKYGDRITWQRIAEIINEDFNTQIEVNYIDVKSAYDNTLKSNRNRRNVESLSPMDKEQRLYSNHELIKNIIIEKLDINDLFLHKEVVPDENGDIKFVVAGCFQIPFHEQKAVNELYKYIKKEKPQLLILNGDFYDLYKMSRFTKNEFINRNLTLWKELNIGLSIIRKINEISPDTVVILRPVASNHEERWYKKIYNESKELMDFLFFDKALFDVAYNNGKGSGIKFYISTRKNDYLGNTKVTHAGSLSKYGVHHNIADVENSCIVNHSHRAGISTKVFRDTGRMIYSVEAGCMCMSNIEYLNQYKFVRAFCYGEYNINNGVSEIHLKLLEDLI